MKKIGDLVWDDIAIIAVIFPTLTLICIFITELFRANFDSPIDFIAHSFVLTILFAVFFHAVFFRVIRLSNKGIRCIEYAYICFGLLSLVNIYFSYPQLRMYFEAIHGDERTISAQILDLSKGYLARQCLLEIEGFTSDFCHSIHRIVESGGNDHTLRELANDNVFLDHVLSVDCFYSQFGGGCTIVYPETRELFVDLKRLWGLKSYRLDEVRKGYFIILPFIALCVAIALKITKTSLEVFQRDAMSLVVTLKHPEKHALKTLKTGWSWTMFFFASAWGVIWFIRGLYDWSVVTLLFSILVFFVGEESAIYWLLSLVALGFNIWAAINGNKITAKRYLSQGYEFVEPGSEPVQYAKRQWQIS